jgi:hypothetical protein
MSQDRFLTALYESLLKGETKEYKTGYKTMAESYKAVYESDGAVVDNKPQILISVNSFETKQWSPQQKSLYDLTANNVKKTAGEELPDEYNPDVAPEEEKKASKTTGVGPGEYAVVSVVTGLTDEASCAKYLSGTNKDYDITWPSGSKHPEFKFEIKDIQKGPARIAKHGAEFTRDVITDVTRILDTIIDEYELLTSEDRAHVDSYIKAEGVQISEPETVLYKKAGRNKTGRTWAKGDETPESLTSKEKHKRKVEQSSAWNVAKWAKGIKENTRELPWNIINGEDEQTIIRGDIPIFMSLKTFANIIETIEGWEVEETGGEHKEKEENVERINAVTSVFKKYYGSSAEEKKAVLDHEIAQTAKQVDKKLLKAKAEKTGESVSNWRAFFHELHKENILEKIKQLELKINSDKSIFSLFPKDITGLFFVNASGYWYIPHSELANYVEITTISSGGPKITLKQANIGAVNEP